VASHTCCLLSVSQRSCLACYSGSCISCNLKHEPRGLAISLDHNLGFVLVVPAFWKHKLKGNLLNSLCVYTWMSLCPWTGSLSCGHFWKPLLSSSHKFLFQAICQRGNRNCSLCGSWFSGMLLTEAYSKDRSLLLSAFWCLPAALMYESPAPTSASTLKVLRSDSAG
jgi:hypothetical protein